MKKLKTSKAQAAAMERVSDDDRAWFAARPGRRFRLRPVSEIELQYECQLVGRASSKPCEYVRVEQVRPGARLRRRFTTQAPLHHPERWTDESIAAFTREIPENDFTREFRKAVQS